MADTSWTISTDKSWIHVSPTSGSGDKTINVRTDSATSSEDINGTITIVGSNGTTQTIAVQRCVKCTPATSITYGSVSTSYTACDSSTSKKVNVPYTSVTTDAQCNTASTTATTSVTFNDLSGKNCGEQRSQTITLGGQTVAVGTQAGGCQDPDCYEDCRCNPEYAQKSVPTVSCDAQSVTIVYEITGFTNCDNPNCDSRIGETASTSVEIGCNSQSGTVDRTGSSSYGTWTVHQEGGCQCGECLYKCSDFISLEPYNMPLPAEGGNNVPIGIWRYHYIDGGRGDYAQGLGVIVETENQTIVNGNGNGFLYFGDRAQDSTSYYKILYAKKINENTSTETRTSRLINILKYHCAQIEYDYDTRNQIPDEIKCGYFDNITITQEGKAVTYCECYKDIVVSPVTASSYSDTSATINWTYTHRKADGTTETGSSSTTVSFEANDTTSTVTRTGSTTWTNHKLCDGNDCGDNAVINWEVNVPGKPAEPDYSQQIWVSFVSTGETSECVSRINRKTSSDYVTSDSYQLTIYGGIPDGSSIDLECLLRDRSCNQSNAQVQIDSSAGSGGDYGVADVTGWYRDPNAGNAFVNDGPIRAEIICNNGTKIYINIDYIYP